jgi:hypothetical protein
MIFLLTIFSGCVTKEAVKNVSDEEVLRERVIAYWNLRINKEFEKTYDYEYLPSMPKARYMVRLSNPLIEYKAFEIKNIRFDTDDSADIEMSVRVVAKAPGARAFEHESIIKERWVKAKGIWHHVSPLSKGFTHD